MKINDIKKLAKKWSEFNIEYGKLFGGNSASFPEPILKKLIDLALPNMFKRNMSKSYDYSDSKGNDRIELKSSYKQGWCPFSKNQKNCQRIIYVELNDNYFAIFEIESSKVKQINQINTTGIKFKKYMLMMLNI